MQGAQKCPYMVLRLCLVLLVPKNFLVILSQSGIDPLVCLKALVVALLQQTRFTVNLITEKSKQPHINCAKAESNRR